MSPIVSLITPTHKTDKLYRLYESIAAQTDKRFEWIIIPNGNADVSVLPKEDWIKIIPYTDTNLNIGALKNFGFSQGKGELLAEVDHDDELMPHCVETLIANKDKADFLYSNNLVLTEENEPYVWGTGYGWVITTYNYKGKECNINVAFPPYPTNFAWQWWAPNHIRVWNRDFYRRLGGHDVNLKVCDDGDILCRTMINGTIHHINDVLYIYYLHSQNSHATTDLQSIIQKHVPTMYVNYIVEMAKSWSYRNGYSVALQEGIFNTNSTNNSVGLVLLQDLYLTGTPERYMKRISDILAPGGVAVISNPSSIEKTNIITESNLRFWDKTQAKYAVNGTSLIGSHVHTTNNTRLLFLVKHVPGLHIARNVLNYN